MARVLASIALAAMSRCSGRVVADPLEGVRPLVAEVAQLGGGVGGLGRGPAERVEQRAHVAERPAAAGIRLVGPLAQGAAVVAEAGR